MPLRSKILLAMSIIGALAGSLDEASTYAAGTEAITRSGTESQYAQMMGGGMMGRGGMMGGYPSGADNVAPYTGTRTRELESSNGRAFAENCARCHGLPDPRQHTSEEWPPIVARMEAHARDANMPVADAQTVEQIDAFLKDHASRADTR